MGNMKRKGDSTNSDGERSRLLSNTDVEHPEPHPDSADGQPDGSDDPGNAGLGYGQPPMPGEIVTRNKRQTSTRRR